MVPNTLSYNPFDPASMADPYPIYRSLRDHSPTHWSEGARCWVLSRYDDVANALRDPGTYSSASGVFPTADAPDMADLFLPMLIMTDPPASHGTAAHRQPRLHPAPHRRPPARHRRPGRFPPGRRGGPGCVGLRARPGRAPASHRDR